MEGKEATGDRPARIHLKFLGAAEATVDGRSTVFRTRKSFALLAYLALDRGPHTRERLADLLWPGGGGADARASLRTSLNYLRRALACRGESVLVATRESLGLRPGSLRLDIDVLKHAQRLVRTVNTHSSRFQIEAAVNQYRGPFLAGMLLPDAPDFEAWIEAQRTYWAGIESELLDRLATQHMDAGDPAAAIDTLERWTLLNPDEDIAWQRLIDAHLRRGDPLGARRAWGAYRQALKELDAGPSHQMAELNSRIVRLRDATLERWLDAVDTPQTSGMPEMAFAT